MLELTVWRGRPRAHNTRSSVIDRTRFGCKRNYVCQRKCFMSFVKGTVHVAHGNREKDTLWSRISRHFHDRSLPSLSLSCFQRRLSLGASESVFLSLAMRNLSGYLIGIAITYHSKWGSGKTRMFFKFIYISSLF